MVDDKNVLPFGKYKGKTIEEVQLQDANYLEWLCAQAWFRDKFIVLHQTIINQGAQPEDTPEHNALQVLFLDNRFCLAVAEASGWKGIEIFEANRAEELTARYGADQSWIDKRLQSAKNAVYSPIVTRKHFEALGVDVCFRVVSEPLLWADFNIEIKPLVSDDYPSVLRQIRRRFGTSGVPSSNEILLLERFDARGATRQQFVDIFKASDISVVFLADVAL